MTTAREPVPEPEVDVKKLEANLKEQEKENLEGVKKADQKNEDGQTKYAGGPIPRR